MLTEKEIKELENILYKAMLEVPSVGELLKLASDREGAEWKVLAGWYCEVAAAAIAKRLSEGVVWSGQGRMELRGVSYHGIISDHGVSSDFARTLRIELTGQNMRSAHELLPPNGQLVSVTVKIVEGK